MTTTTTNQPQNIERTDGQPWVYIEPVGDGPVLAVGPYPSEPAALHALMHAPLIDAFCEEDCLDAWVATEPVPGAAKVLIDPTDPDHTGADLPEEEALAMSLVGLLGSLVAIATTKGEA